MSWQGGFGNTLDVSELVAPVELPVEELLPRFKRWLYFIAYGLDPARVDDLAQEGYIAMWRARKQFDPSRMPDSNGALVNYLTTSAKRRMRELVLRGRPEFGQPERSVRVRPSGADTRLTSSVQVESIVSVDALLPHELDVMELLHADAMLDGIALAYHHGEIVQAIGELTPQQQRYVVLRFWGGMSTAEIAAILEVSEGRARQLWNGSSSQAGARASLRRSLAHLAAAV